MTLICHECQSSLVRMIRNFFLTQGLCVLLAGLLLVLVDRFVLAVHAEPTIGPPEIKALWTSIDAENRYVCDPPDWLGYAAISLGAVITLYVVSLPKRRCSAHGGDEH